MRPEQRLNFQSTLLQEERLEPCTVETIFLAFNPRSYKRSDFYKIHLHLIIDLSIHAPTRGATKTLCLLFTLKALSIHAPTRGATITLVYPYTLHFTFNPRSYKRSDGQHFQILNCQIIFQSTLLQEERRWISIYPRNDTSFNPRSYKRSDPTRTPTGKP